MNSDYDFLSIGIMGFCKLPLSSGLLEVCLCWHIIFGGRRTTQ